MNHHTLCALICMSALTLGGCKVKRPSDVIAEDKMEQIIYDYHIAKALGDNLPYDENYKRQLYIDAVFSKYGVAEADFDSSLVWYTRNTEKLSDIYERVAQRLKAEQENLEAQLSGRDKRDMTSAAGDSVDIWMWNRLIELGTMSLDNHFSFKLEADSNYKVNDTFVFSSDFKLANGRLGGAQQPVVSIQLVYDNDSVVGITRRITQSGQTIITLGDDKIGTVKALNGLIYRPVADKGRSANVIVSNITLMRYHSNDSIISVADSVAVDSATVDSVAKKLPELKIDAEKAEERLSPEQRNKRRTNINRVERPEQIEVEKKILDEKRTIERRDAANKRKRFGTTTTIKQKQSR